MLCTDDRPVAQVYSDRRVQRPEWWPAAYEWAPSTVNSLERRRLDELFILMRDWKAAREVRSTSLAPAVGLRIASTGLLSLTTQCASPSAGSMHRPLSCSCASVEYIVARRGSLLMLKLPGGVVSLLRERGSGQAMHLQRMSQRSAMQKRNQVTILHRLQSAAIKHTQRTVIQTQQRRNPAQLMKQQPQHKAAAQKAPVAGAGRLLEGEAGASLSGPLQH